MQGFTYVTVVNHVQDLVFNASASQGAGAEAYGPASFEVKPEATASECFWVQRGIPNGTSYTVTAEATLGGMPLQFSLTLEGTFADSNMWVRAEIGGQSTYGIANDGESCTVNASLEVGDNALVYAITAQRVAAGPLRHDDVVITIAPVGQLADQNHILMPYEKCEFFPLLDIWGEGRIVDTPGWPNDPPVTGFPEAYNLNKTGQMISNGPNKGKQIPNFVPVANWDTPKFPIADSSVIFMTMMGAMVNDTTAAEMVRVLDKQKGVVLLYSPDKNSLQAYRNRLPPSFVPKQTAASVNDLRPPFDQIYPDASHAPVFVFGWSGHDDKVQLVEYENDGQEHDEL